MLLRRMHCALVSPPDLASRAADSLHSERVYDEFSVYTLASGEQYGETLLALAGKITDRPSV